MRSPREAADAEEARNGLDWNVGIVMALGRDATVRSLNLRMPPTSDVKAWQFPRVGVAYYSTQSVASIMLKVPERLARNHPSIASDKGL